MSKDKQKKLQRAYDLLREINCGRYTASTLTGRRHGDHWRFSMKHPIVKYILRRGLAKLARVHHENHGNAFDTKLDTGVPWARQWQRGDKF